jgi:hypothetical protein
MMGNVDWNEASIFFARSRFFGAIHEFANDVGSMAAHVPGRYFVTVGDALAS